MSALGRVAVVPGEGVVARFGPVLVGIPNPGADPELSGQVLAWCREAAADVASRAPGRTLARRLAAELGQRTDRIELAFATVAVASEDGQVGIFVHGATSVTLDEEEVLDGTLAASWVDRIVGPEVQRIRVGAEAKGGTGAAGDLLLDLLGGSVLGAGAVVERGGAGEAEAEAEAQIEVEVEDATDHGGIPPVPPPKADDETSHAGFPAITEPPVEEEPARPPEPFDAISLDADADAAPRDPLPLATSDKIVDDSVPMVLGVLCNRQHFNHPDARYCGVCGLSMAQHTHQLTEGPRPPLGVFVLDDGSTFSIDADYVIGREPQHDEAVEAGRARPLELDDPGRTVSRVHAAIRLDGWNVTVVDRGSANGTFLAARDATEWTRLEPDSPLEVPPGTRLRLGDRTLVFESHHRRAD